MSQRKVAEIDEPNLMIMMNPILMYTTICLYLTYLIDIYFNSYFD